MCKIAVQVHMIKPFQSKLFWSMVVFVSTSFVPWRVIYKGTSVFTVLPLWWEYGDPKNMVVVGHIAFSVISGVTLSTLLRLVTERALRRDDRGT